MPRIAWDQAGARVYETGLDRGVLYLPNGTAVPWNGLTSIIEHFDKETTPVYFDGTKINDLISIGSFNASMKAVTYPDEFLELEGLDSDRLGLYFADQQPQAFGLCYRTQIGSDTEGDVAGYKIHILYNVTALPSEKTYATVSADPSLVEFEWTISAVPEEVSGFRPTAHIVLDSRKLDPWLLEELEAMLYGGIGTPVNASLIPMTELITYLSDWYRIKITDNGDGTWTAETLRDGFIHYGSDGYFDIVGANAVYLNDYTFVISDTLDVSDVQQIKITRYPDGTWNATTDQDGLIIMTSDFEFEIRNAHVEWINEYTYRISDTTDED